MAMLGKTRRGWVDSIATPTARRETDQMGRQPLDHAMGWKNNSKQVATRVRVFIRVAGVSFAGRMVVTLNLKAGWMVGWLVGWLHA